MKRQNNLYMELISVENCKRAIEEAARHKARRSSVHEIIDHADFYAKDLSKRLQEMNFLTPYRPRTIKDASSGKTRNIQVPTFYPDQCAHHAIIQIIGPYIKRSTYYWSCANMPGKGLDLACIGVERATKKDTKHARYCIKCDIKKFYPSIPHDKLKEALRRKFKDKNLLEVIDKVIDSHDEGLPIGNYTSPWLAELYLQPLDNAIKQTYKAKHYIRYADDIVVIGSNKRKLRKTLNGIIKTAAELGLHIKDNYQLFYIERDGRGRKIDFVGKCFAIGYTTVRKRRALAFMRQSRKIQELQAENAPISYSMASGFVSRSACLKHTNSEGLKKKYYDTVDIKDLKEVIRHESNRLNSAGAAAPRTGSAEGRILSDKADGERQSEK